MKSLPAPQRSRRDPHVAFKPFCGHLHATTRCMRRCENSEKIFSFQTTRSISSSESRLKRGSVILSLALHLNNQLPADAPESSGAAHAADLTGPPLGLLPSSLLACLQMDAEGRGYMRPVEAIASTRERRLTGQRVIVVLEGASLELAQGKDRSLQLLNSLEHKQLLRKCDRQGDEVRPDIAHHCLLSLQESPLNRAGRLCVFIRTADRQLIEISPLLTVPPTYQEFAKLMTNLLYARRLKAVEKNVTLAQIVKNEHANFLPPNSVKVALTVSGRSVALSEFVQRFKETDTPVVFVVGAVAHSDPTGECDYVDDKISIAGVGLTAAVCCSSICAEFEALWDIF